MQTISVSVDIVNSLLKGIQFKYIDFYKAEIFDANRTEVDVVYSGYFDTEGLTSGVYVVKVYNSSMSEETVKIVVR